MWFPESCLAGWAEVEQGGKGDKAPLLCPCARRCLDAAWSSAGWWSEPGWRSWAALLEAAFPPLAKTPSSRLRMGLTNSPHVIQAFLLLLLEDGGTESFPV